MSTGIKNGKLHTINICNATLFFLFITLSTFSSSASVNKYDKNRVIVIDAGHGGKDPGARGAISNEKDINLAIALKTGEYIEQNIRNVTVIYTRKDDSTVELRDRPKIANKANADLFISIHANWAKSKNVMGSESYIMFSLTQKVFQEQSTDLASKIQTQFRERVNRNDRDVKQAGFWVLYNTKMPSVLVETGFITNSSEEKYLNSKEGQDYLASSIFRACRDYINSIDSKSSISWEKNQDTAQKNDTITRV